MLMTGRRSATGTRSYRCPPVRGYGEGCVDIKAEPFEEIVEAYARARLADPRVKEELIRTASDTNGGKIAQEIATLETRLVALDNELVESDKDIPNLLRAIQTIKARIDEAQAELASIAPMRVPRGDLPWPESVERRNALIRLVVEAAWVDRADRTSPTFKRERIRIDPMVPVD